MAQTQITFSDRLVQGRPTMTCFDYYNHDSTLALLYSVGWSADSARAVNSRGLVPRRRKTFRSDRDTRFHLELPGLLAVR